MEKYFDINADKHSIRCKAYYEGDLHACDRWVVATYGFGGNKDNHADAKFAERITTKYPGYGAVCFDWPCHGNDARNRLILAECVEYLDIVNRHLRDEMGAERLYNYSASLGAYVTLVYLHEVGDPYERIVLRCPAVGLYRIMLEQMSPEERERYEKKGEVKTGYGRKIPITREFMDELAAHDVASYEYFDDADRILIIHGTKDAVVPIERVAAFADDNVIELVPVENADHPFSNPKSMDYAIQRAIEFMAPR